MFDYRYACATCSKAAQRRLKFWPKTHLKCIKTHIEATINQNFSRGKSPTPLTRGGIPPLVLSPYHTDFRRTTFKYVATGLLLGKRQYYWVPINTFYDVLTKFCSSIIFKYVHCLDYFYACIVLDYIVCLFFEKKTTTTKKNQSRTNGPINAHLTIAQVMLRYNHKKMKNKKHRCKSFVKISAVAQQ